MIILARDAKQLAVTRPGAQSVCHSPRPLRQHM